MTLQQAHQARQSGDLALAETLCRRLLAEQVHDLPAAMLLGAVLAEQGRLTEAVECYRAVLAQAPGDVGALNNLANALQAAGRIDEALPAYLDVLRSAVPPLAYRVASNYLTALQYHPALTEQDLRRAAAELGAQFGCAQPLPAASAGAGTALRIGFVSADLCDHPVGFFLLPLLAHLDRSRVEPLLYANGGRSDATARMLQALAPWRDISSLDQQAAQQTIRADRVDVLFDLSGHTAGNRLPLFAARAAPLQVSWLGYFATTGVPAMDYVLMDDWHAPAGAEAHFTERLLRLPHSRFCYEPVPFAPEPSPPPCLQRGYVTFGCFNNTAKLNDAVLALWARILRALPDSRLILKWRTLQDEPYRQRLLAGFAAAGVAAERIELRGQSFHRELLEQYADVDIALDPFPFSGGQTSCEALWMGLPVLTLPGSRPVSRQTLCFLANIGLHELAAQDEAEYVAKAVQLAGDAAHLQALRFGLRARMRASPLMDARRFAADFADLLERIQAGAA